MKSALVIGNGESSVPLSQGLAKYFDLTVALDGAVHSIPDTLPIDYICGDLDSLKVPELSELHQKATIVDLPSQDANDLEKTISWLQSSGVGRLLVVNIWGGRIDQTLAALSILVRFHNEISISLYSEQTVIKVLSANQQEEFPAALGDPISLCSLAGDAKVSISGTKWELCNEALHAGSQGVSNQAQRNTIQVTVHDGAVVVIHKVPSDDFFLENYLQ